MKTFKEYVSSNLTEDELKILEYALLEESLFESDLNEGAKGFLNSLRDKIGVIADKLERVGIKFKKEDHGLLGVFIKANVNIVKAITLIISWKRANLNNNVQAQQEIKKQWDELRKSLNLKSLTDFLLNLDMVTMHLVTGPLHIFKGLTGIELELFHQSEEVIDKIKKAIDTIKTKIKQLSLPSKVEKKVHKSIYSLDTHISKIS